MSLKLATFVTMTIAVCSTCIGQTEVPQLPQEPISPAITIPYQTPVKSKAMMGKPVESVKSELIQAMDTPVWIWTEQSDSLAWFRFHFDIDFQPDAAKFELTCGGDCTVWIDGKSITFEGKPSLASGSTGAVDLAKVLQPGHHVIAIQATNGNDSSGLKFEIRANGDVEEFYQLSDTDVPSTASTPGDSGWYQPGFDDSSWERSVSVEPIDQKLVGDQIVVPDSFQESDFAAPEWIWSDPPGASALFRFDVDINHAPNSADLDIACDDECKLWVDGNPVMIDGQPVLTLGKTGVIDLSSALTPGTHTIAIEATNRGGPAGLIFMLQVVNDASEIVYVSGSGVRSTSSGPGNATWVQPVFDDSTWGKSKVVGPSEKQPGGQPSKYVSKSSARASWDRARHVRENAEMTLSSLQSLDREFEARTLIDLAHLAGNNPNAELGHVRVPRFLGKAHTVQMPLCSRAAEAIAKRFSHLDFVVRAGAINASNVLLEATSKHKNPEYFKTTLLHLGPAAAQSTDMLVVNSILAKLDEVLQRDLEAYGKRGESQAAEHREAVARSKSFGRKLEIFDEARARAASFDDATKKSLETAIKKQLALEIAQEAQDQITILTLGPKQKPFDLTPIVTRTQAIFDYSSSPMAGDSATVKALHEIAYRSYGNLKVYGGINAFRQTDALLDNAVKLKNVEMTAGSAGPTSAADRITVSQQATISDGPGVSSTRPFTTELIRTDTDRFNIIRPTPDAGQRVFRNPTEDVDPAPAAGATGGVGVPAPSGG